MQKVKLTAMDLKNKVERSYSVLTFFAGIAAATKVATLPHVNKFPVWQIVAGIIFTGLYFTVYEFTGAK